jgi:DNA-binding MarR family transcriptional regulator
MKPMQRGSGRERANTSEATSLLREIINLTEQFEDHLGRELTVNRTDLEAMEQLILDGPLSPTEIARRLGITTAAATVAVDRLIAVGHVTREPHPTDRRGVRIVPNAASVTKAMETLLPMIRGIDRAIDRFDERERATITAYLAEVVDVYRTQLP